MENDKTAKHENRGRVVGFDAHPDSFTAAILRGSTPAAAFIEKTFNKVSLDRLESWARKNTSEEDVIVLEASGNSFHIARLLRKLNRRAEVLESWHLGKLKEAHANNDRISAARIGQAYLAGTAKKVWVPDERTQQRRDWFHAHHKAVKRTTQMRNRLLSLLSDHGVRLPRGTRLASSRAQAETVLRSLKEWSDKQWQVLQIMLDELEHAEKQRAKWRSLIAQEVETDPLLLSLMRLCGVRVVVAFALGAIIGDIHRFASPKALVKYIGLNPSFDDSGKSKWTGGVGGRGRKDLRSLLLEAAHSILRSKHPLAKWGKKLLARKGVRNLVAAAVARKLTVALWYLMMGKWTAVEELDARLEYKLSKLVSTIGTDTLKVQGRTRNEVREQLRARLQNGRTYLLRPPETACVSEKTHN
jgi:transposase